jgi:hypothetical protein
MEEVIVWIRAEGRLPRDRSEDKGERSMARWLSERRREAADGSLSPACRDGLAPVPGWAGNPRAAADEVRWHERLAQLADFRAEGNDWPRHHDYASEREHTLGVWIRPDPADEVPLRRQQKNASRHRLVGLRRRPRRPALDRGPV